jgi:hypothetical protein
MAKPETLLPLRLTFIDPPAGVLFAIQKGKSEIVTPLLANGANLSFDLSVRVQERADGSPNFLGPFVQGPPASRFVYINSGTSAGQTDSCWTRRAKIGLIDITWELIKSATKKSGSVLEITIYGRTRDGGPVCATVKPLTGWTIKST